MAETKQPELSPIFVNNDRVRLQGEAKPQVKQVVSTAGHDPNKTRVFRLKDQNDQEGTRMTIEEFIDRTEEPSNPVWLKCLEMARERKETGVQAYSGQATPETGAIGGEPAPSPTTQPTRTPSPQPEKGPAPPGRPER